MKPPINQSPNPLPDESWEELVRQSARGLPYPPTPDIAGQVAARLARERGQWAMHRLRPIWVASILFALLLGLWAVPPVRAAILEFLQIGAVRIWLGEPTPTPEAAPAATSTVAPASSAFTPSITPAPSTPFNLAGETTLAEAEAKAGFAVPLPTYPPDIGPPDAVFYQELAGPVVVLVWMKPEEPGVAEYSLHILGNGAFAHKTNPPLVITTTVDGIPAAWTNGPYILAYGGGSQREWETRYLVSGRVLIWEKDGLTYRLESELSMDEAIRMAESLQ
jgi:hypothetical protein